MNKKAKILSLCLAAVLLCACIVGFMVVGAGAASTEANDEGGTTYTWTVKSSGADYTSIEAALQAAAEREWGENDELIIQFNGNVSASCDDSGRFGGVPTIWRGVGNKLPITIKGNAANRTLTPGNLVDKDVYFTNDYTFQTFKINSAWLGMKLYAGSGNVVFENITSVVNTVTANFYADNFTETAYIGWTQEDVEEIKAANGGYIPSSITLGSGMGLTGSRQMDASVVGFSPSEGQDAFTAVDSTIGSLEDGVTIKPSDTTAELILAADCEHELNARVGTSPVADARLTIDDTVSFTGEINLSADAWKANETYLTYTGDAELADLLGKTADKTGRVLAVNGEVGETQTLKLAEFESTGAKLVLTERIAVRVYFSKEDVAKVGGEQNLALTATGLDEIFVSTVQEDEDEYFFDVYGITASNLEDVVTYTGSVNGTVEKTLNDILEATMPANPETAEETALVNLCKSIQQLGGAKDVTVEAETHTLSTEAGVYFNDGAEAFDATGYAVAMNDAIGFAIYGTGEGYTVTLNGVEVEPQQGEGCIYIFVKVSKADKLMDIKITNATTGDVDFRMVASVQDLASLGAGTDTNSCNILAYTQAALAYKEACAA